MFTKLEAVGYNKNLAWVSVALPRPQHEHQLSGGLRWVSSTTCSQRLRPHLVNRTKVSGVYSDNASTSSKIFVGRCNPLPQM